MKTIDELQKSVFKCEIKGIESFFLLTEILGFIGKYPEIIQSCEFLLRFAAELSEFNIDTLKQNGLDFDKTLKEARDKGTGFDMSGIDEIMKKRGE